MDEWNSGTGVAGQEARQDILRGKSVEGVDLSCYKTEDYPVDKVMQEMFWYMAKESELGAYVNIDEEMDEQSESD